VVINRLGAAITSTAQQAATLHNCSFKQWVHEHIDGKPGVLYKYSNQENLPQGILDEVFLDGGVLCTSKELMEHRVTTWTEVWGTSSSPRQTSKNFSGFEQTCRELQQLHPMEPIDADDVRKCMAGAPAKAAVGSDQWRPHDWASLPDEGIHDVVQLLHKIEEKGRWPEQVLCNLVVFIGKPTPRSKRETDLAHLRPL
jgi:hypothetical protein